MIDICKGRKYFTQLDLAPGYLCLNVREEDREKTSFSVPYGKCEFMRMPFGLKNSQATFHRMIDKVINSIVQKGCKDVAAYVDNIFIFSETFEEHLLGFHIGNDEVTPCRSNVQKLIDIPVPKTKRRVQRLMGKANFNRRFVPNYAEITKPLTSLLSDKIPFLWKQEQQERMDKLIAGLSSFPALGLPDFGRTFYIQTDASDVAVGGVLFSMIMLKTVLS